MNTSRSEFMVALMQELVVNSNNWYGSENWDHERFGSYKGSFKGATLNKLNKLLSGKAAIVPVDADGYLIQSIGKIKNSLEGLAASYDLLADDYSKSTLVKVLAYRLMGPRKVKLPLSTDAYWSIRERTRSLIKGSDTIGVNFPKLNLNRLNLEKIGYPIELYFAPGGVMVTFILKQYEYGKSKPQIKAQNGDYVIDAGGCWGDTALYFAHTVGPEGKVYCFEFVAENLKILQRNLDLNAELARRIELVLQPVWEESGEVVEFSANGPGTSLTGKPSDTNRLNFAQVSTIAIDDLVKERNIPRVDFIKMDIEGAELSALKGAEECLRRFRPRLAISVYHRENDLIEIPNYLNNLGLGYKFFLDHFTIYGEETILFATSGN